ncbi:MAG TPA: hypothetical protein VI685_20665 [Candidatus Angelobacter sp.]
MIDKFNFYDIFGYFLPGASLLLLLWLPFGLVRKSWPASDLGSAVIGVVVAYVAGHFLQMICTKVIPSTVALGQHKRPRYPSDVVIDKDNSNLSIDFKKKLEARVKEKFDLDIGVEQPESKELDQVRRDAFFLARHILIRAKQVSYAEQFEGLYTLTRNLAGALAIACVNYIGWAVSIVRRTWLDCVVIVIVTVSLLAAATFAAQLLREQKDLQESFGKNASMWLERLSALALMLTALGVGYWTGRRYEVTPVKMGELAVCGIGALLGALRCYSAYKSFTNSFAITIWRDFFASTDAPAPPSEALEV